MQRISTVTVVVAVALIAPDRRVLLQRRRAGKQHGGLWEFPGGKVEPLETPESALVREIEEELGLSIDPAALDPLTFSSGLSPSTESALVILFYTCRSWSGEPACLDGEEIRWLALSELAGLEMPPLDYPLVRALVAAGPG